MKPTYNQESSSPPPPAATPRHRCLLLLSSSSSCLYSTPVMQPNLNERMSIREREAADEDESKIKLSACGRRSGRPRERACKRRQKNDKSRRTTKVKSFRMRQQHHQYGMHGDVTSKVIVHMIVNAQVLSSMIPSHMRHDGGILTVCIRPGSQARSSAIVFLVSV